MDKKEIIDSLKREKAKLEISSKIYDFSKQMSSNITEGMVEMIKDGSKTKDYSKTYKKVPWLWK